MKDTRSNFVALEMPHSSSFGKSINEIPQIGDYFVIVVESQVYQPRVVVPLCALWLAAKSIQAPPERLKARRLDVVVCLYMVSK